MSGASILAAERIIRTNSEGFRADVYDDADGEPIQCRGQPTVGYGCRCRQWSTTLGAGVLNLQLQDVEESLLRLGWYTGCNDPRRSALLEIAFNQGFAGLVRGYPRLLQAVGASDWAEAAAQCTVREPALQVRYGRLADILKTGVDQ